VETKRPDGTFLYHADFVLVKEDSKLVLKRYWDVKGYAPEFSAKEKRLIRSVGYGPSHYTARPLLHRVFKENLMILDMTHEHSPKYYDELEKFLRELGETYGFTIVVLSNFAGAKMGGKRFPVYFMGRGHTMMNWAREEGIFDYLYALSSAKRFEREKKFLGMYVKFDIAPRVRIIPDLPTFPGVAFADPGWMEQNNLMVGFKLAGPSKATVHPFPENAKWAGADLVIQESDNKLKLPAELFALKAGYDPTLDPDKRYSKDLTWETKSGETIEGRDPNFGLDIQATLGLTPRVDLTDVNRILMWDFDDEIITRYFKYLDRKTNTLVLNDLGKEIFEQGKTMMNTDVRLHIYGILIGIVRRMARKQVVGEYASAAPLELAPKEARKLIRTHVVIGYSGGICGRAQAVVWNSVAYVETSVWLAMGRDFDGDLAFLFPYRDFPNKHLVLSEVDIRASYVLPPKPTDEGDDRDDIKTLMDSLKQSSLCGAAYNNGKIFIDACRMAEMPADKLTKLEVSVMALVEQFIFGFKGKVTATKAFTAGDLAEKFGVIEAMQHIEHITKFFFPIRSGGTVLINRVPYTAFEALLIRAKEADPNSKSFNERTCSRFKDLGPLPSPNQLEAGVANKEYEEELVKKKTVEVPDFAVKVVDGIVTGVKKVDGAFDKVAEVIVEEKILDATYHAMVAGTTAFLNLFSSKKGTKKEEKK
jgi:hypothetical protein